MADETVFVELDVMIIEAGIMAASVPSSDAGKPLQARIQQAADEAWAAQQPDVVISFTPFEAGMLLGGLSRSSGNVTGDLINRTFTAVNAKMQELGIQPLNNPQQSLDAGGQGPAAGLDPLAPLPDDSGTDSSASQASAPDATSTDSTSSAATDSTGSAPTASTDSTETASTPSSQPEGQDGGAQ